MVKFPEASARIMESIFVCKKCKGQQRSDRLRIVKGMVACRKCGSKSLRPKRKK